MGEACAFSDPALILLRAGFTGADVLDETAKQGRVNSKQYPLLKQFRISLPRGAVWGGEAEILSVGSRRL